MDEVLAIIKQSKGGTREANAATGTTGCPVQFGILLNSKGRVRCGCGKNKWTKNMTSIDDVNLVKAQK